jgi:hypothetical protein
VVAANETKLPKRSCGESGRCQVFGTYCPRTHAQEMAVNGATELARIELAGSPCSPTLFPRVRQHRPERVSISNRS